MEETEAQETEAQMQARSKASEALLEKELEQRGLKSVNGYHAFLWEHLGLCLDGYYQLPELEALVAVMRARKEGSLVLDSFSQTPQAQK